MTASPASRPPTAHRRPSFGSNGGEVAAVDDTKIIRTGTMTLQVSDLAPALTAARDGIVGLGGYIGASTTSNDGDKPSAEITYRIPADKWEAALDLLHGLGGLTTKVVAEHTEAVEVTGQVVDLEANIANLRASETALQGIAANATKISDVLEVQAQLTTDPWPDPDADGAAQGPQRPRGVCLDDGRLQRPGRRRRGRRQGLGPGRGRRRGGGHDGVRAPERGDSGHLVRDRVAADPPGRGRRRPRRGLDRAPDPAAERRSGEPAATGSPSPRGRRRARLAASIRAAPGPAWHDASMTEQAERYDRIATGYARWWAPVLTPAVLELLDETAERLAAGGHVLDLGTGTGQLAIEALTRWPGLSVVGIDASAEMRAMADGEATRRLAAAVRDRFETVVAFADELPFPDGTFDLALSSFVVQLVPNRARVLREVRRVLRPGATFAYVSWLQDGRAFPPDDIFDDLLDEFDIGDDEDDDPGRPGDLPSVDRAAGELRRAGFAGVSARAGELTHRFTVERLHRLHGRVPRGDAHREPRARDPDAVHRRRCAIGLAALTPQQMTMRFPIVFASGRRSA